MSERIKCGKCASEYSPRKRNLGTSQVAALDYSCPVCGHGKFAESMKKEEKKVLLDWREY